MMSEEEEEEEEALWRFAVSFPQARAEYIKKCNIYSWIASGWGGWYNLKMVFMQEKVDFSIQIEM